MKKTPEINMNAHQRYENKRVAKPISFNKEKDSDLLDVVDNIEFGVWVKHVLRSYTKLEASLLKNDMNILPAILIERALEAGNFDLDEYLLSKGKKIVSAKDEKAQSLSEFCDAPFDEYDIYNQEFEYQ